MECFDIENITDQPLSLILFGHGARDPSWVYPLERLREAIQRLDPRVNVRLAFLEFMQPTLAEAIDQCIASGFLRVDIIPFFLAQGGHVKRDVPLMLDAARQRHPDARISLRQAVGEVQAVIDVMALYALNIPCE